jgi:hypothetical protein
MSLQRTGAKAIYDADAANAPGGGPGTDWKERGLLLIKMSLVHRKGKLGHTDLRKPAMREPLAKIVRAAHRNELKGLPGEVGIQLAGTHCTRSGLTPDGVMKDCNCCGSFACTENLQQQKGLVKSMWLKALDVVLKKDAEVTWDPIRNTHVVYAIDVEAVIVKVLLGPLRNRVLYPGLPAGVIPLPTVQHGATVTVPGSGQVYVGMCQVPIISSRCLTGHKMQGMTVDAVHLFDFKRSGVADRQWLYVACSRPTTLAGLCAEEALDNSPWYWNKPSYMLDHEHARLRLMELQPTVRILEVTDLKASRHLLEQVTTA